MPSDKPAHKVPVEKRKRQKEVQQETSEEKDLNAEALQQEKARSPENDVPNVDERMQELESRLADAEKQAAENYDRLLRATAEFDNYKKRTTREMEEYRRFANEQLLKDLLPVVDDLQRALESSRQNNGTDGIAEGVRLTLNAIHKIFEKFSVKPIEALERPFDPTLHQAVLQEENNEYPDNTVVKEFQKGYLLNDRLLRPAMVVVSKNSAGEE